MNTPDLTLIAAISSPSDGNGYVVSVYDYDVFEHGDFLRARRSNIRTVEISKKQMDLLNKAHAVIMGADKVVKIKKMKTKLRPSKKDRVSIPY